MIASRALRVNGSRLEQGAKLGKRSSMLREQTPVDGGTTLARIVESEDHAHGGRLPGAVRPEEPSDDPRANGEAEVVDRDRLAVALRDGGDFDHASTMNAQATRHIVPPQARGYSDRSNRERRESRHPAIAS